MSSDEKLLNDALFGAAREIGSAVTPDGLSERGIRKVRYIPKEKMAALLERTVQRILEERRANAQDISHLVGDVQSGLLGLLRGAHDVEAARRDIAEQRHTLESELDALAREHTAGGKLADQGRPLTDTERAVRDRDLIIDRLERRVTKLIATLKATEHALQHALVNQNLETGIESLYRVVQGLPASDPMVEQKRAMMKEIFQANVELLAAFARNRAVTES
jgi:hypothetical protein